MSILFFVGSLRKRVETNEILDEIVSADTDEEELKLDSRNKIAPRTDLVKHRANIKEILVNSNATPIRRFGGIGYTCCFCEEQYINPADLKTHTLKAHLDVTKANFMTHMNMSEFVIKLDITGLNCKLCNTEINTLENFVDHLKNVHEKNIFTDVKSHIFPFKFDNEPLKCMICSNSFNRFRMLARHMHIHYRNFICTKCDAGFVNRNALAQHAENHRTGEFSCDFCPKVYKTQVKKRLHERAAHTHVEMMYKCGYCTETFKDYRNKEAHSAAVHGVTPLTPKCQACDKVFNNRRLLNIHVKRDHLMERPHKCSECEMSFYTTTGLKNHMVKHTGSREYHCSICLKSYGRKKTLNSHMRIHEEERFKCKHCGRAFVQKCSWRGHMRTKHGEIV